MYNAREEEQKILEFWDKDKTFEKSVNSRPEDKPYHFYDGPPYATGLPHYGHLVASLMKDVVPRYWTMRGFRVERKWGWDCHGLPVENIVEKELNLGTKRDIENYGVAKFNEACRSIVLKYTSEWKKTVRKFGRWVDMENDYKTMNIEFMESVWWVVRQLWDQGLIYKGYKPMHICPRCVTPLSNFEVTQGYKDIKDISVVAKFKLRENEIFKKLKLPEGTQVLAWTTTPWTLPGNLLLAVNAEVEYVLINLTVITEEAGAGDESEFTKHDEFLILAKERISEVLKDKKFIVEKTFLGRDLVGLEYEPLFPYFEDTQKAFRVVSAEFVSTGDGTGVVHIAPAYGEDDFNVGKTEGLPLVQHVNMEGKFTEAVADFPGMEVKPKDDSSRTDVEIIKWLAHKGKLFSKEKIEHSYPHCWRCDTPLLNFATTSWFVKVGEIKEQLLNNNETINWVPEHIKDGRFGKWLEGARDWAISRSRYWGTPVPIWENEDGETLCIGSVQELEKLSGEKVTDLHKHKIDHLVINKNGKEYRRIPEVLDVWFDSGSMPYGQMHYPFENKKKFESSFPAEFIAEGQDQTRGWFYTLHVLATSLTMGKKPAIPVKKNEPAFKNVIVNGIVLAEDGKKMSKRLKNYPEPEIVLDKFGADALRYYLATSPVVEAENLNFSEAGVREMFNKVVNTLYNVLEFYQMFAGEKVEKVQSENILDQWVLGRLQILIKEVTEEMENYRLASAGRPIMDFITELSQWYVRRSRDRFKGDDDKDKMAAVSTLKEVLVTLSKVMAPFTPFIAEKVFLAVTGEAESVHLQDWPIAEKKVDEEVLNEMKLVRKVVELGLAIRAESGIKVRQVLGELTTNLKLSDQGKRIISEEMNVKKVTDWKTDGSGWVIKTDGEVKAALNTEITPELKKEGLLREVVRTINQMRKEMKLTIEDRISIQYQTEDRVLNEILKDFGEDIKKNTLAQSLENGSGDKQVKIDEMDLVLRISKI